MRLTLPLPPRYDLRALHDLIAALGIPGFTGVSGGAAGIHAEFPERESLEPQEEASISLALSSYLYTPTWRSVRRLRAPLLIEADWRIQRAEDAGEDATALRAYRQALRDVTTQPDEDTPTWPTRPWQ